MWPLNANDIEQLHFDLTNFCNAKCPECVREIDNLCWPFLDKDMLSFDLIKEKITNKIMPRLRKIRFCGSFGDPLTHVNLYEITKHFIDQWPEIEIELSTNGGLKNTKQWQRLAELYQGKRYIIFGIDGLQDTNSRYRVGVNWDKLQDNVNAFIKAGGHAQWQFIMFPWNEHQIFEARDFSIQQGFKKFFVISSHRNPEVNPNYTSKELKVQEEELQKIDKSVHSDFDRSNRKLLPKNKTPIDCEVLGTRDIMIMATGAVYPCCHLGARMFADDPKMNKWYELAGGRSTINLKNHSLDEILQGKFFNIIYLSWAISESSPVGKCKGCIETCTIKKENKEVDKKYVI
jgi:MoaA/NifB/PqqE/SkfB family radical SAM enzyme